MFDKVEISRAVDLQKRSYELLKWVAAAIKRGFISFSAAHSYSTLPSAAEFWIQRHYHNIPETARPPLEDLGDFCGLFSTYLENSFELVSSPGERLYSPGNHCFCPWCSWMTDAPNLKTKSPTQKDKQRARKMMLEVIKRIAAENNMQLAEQRIEALANDPDLRETIALCAYGDDLLCRMKSFAAGPATLVLWRNFAWLPGGAPKKKFELTADLILDAEKALSARILSEAFRYSALQVFPPAYSRRSIIR
jgi:hypothetical protein